MLKRRIVISRESGHSVYINTDRVKCTRHWDADDVRIAYGLGKWKNQLTRDALKAKVEDIGTATRHGCLSASMLALFDEKEHAYVSLKEIASKTIRFAWMAKEAEYEVTDVFAQNKSGNFTFFAVKQKFKDTFMDRGSSLYHYVIKRHCMITHNFIVSIQIHNEMQAV